PARVARGQVYEGVAEAYNPRFWQRQSRFSSATVTTRRTTWIASWPCPTACARTESIATSISTSSHRKKDGHNGAQDKSSAQSSFWWLARKPICADSRARKSQEKAWAAPGRATSLLKSFTTLKAKITSSFRSSSPKTTPDTSLLFFTVLR